MAHDELCFSTATDIAARIRSRDISAREVMEAHLAQIEKINPTVNAIVSQLPPDDSLKAAEQADAALARGDDIGPLHGLPIAHKDTEATKGVRSTSGSPIHADLIPEHTSFHLERVQAAGAIMIGKTNVPEFAAGSHTFNPVFGATYNPHDQTKTAGGSSGGAAVALACGMLPIADGSDLGGSLRNPGNFNNVVGFRPSPGRVPNIPNATGYNWISIKGPLARTVSDTALLFSTMVGRDDRDPLLIDEPGDRFRQPLDRDFSGVNIAWSPDLGGLPVDHRVSEVLSKAIPVMQNDLGTNIDEATPDFSDVDWVFQVFRAYRMAATFDPIFEANRHQIKESVIWNVEQGRSFTAVDVGLAEQKQAAFYQRMLAFLEKYQFLICPVNQVPPFDVSIDYPTEINGVQMENYISWMKSAYYISTAGLPCISVPAGFTSDGLPVGLQIVGRPRDDFGVLQLAHAFEQATQHWKIRPPVVA
ncbi:MAG: amidase [Sphaerobacteraceae bacterium]|nr:MAG: amidase [Sphaerobacteraceae bacterium]